MDEINVTSAQYISFMGNTQAEISAVIGGVTMIVPIDTANRHYAAIKAKHDDADDSFTIQDAD